MALRYVLPAAANAELRICDVSGRRVRSLVSGWMEAGVREVTWMGVDTDGRRVLAGVYFAQLVTPDGRRSTRFVLMP